MGTNIKLSLTSQPSLLPESRLLFDSAFACSLSAPPLQALDTFVNHESIFKSVFFFRGCIPVPKMIKYVLKQVKKKSILVFI